MGIVLTAAPARADRTMQEELARLARDVEKYLQGQNEMVVDVGLFTGPAECNVEAQLRQIFLQELERLRIKIDKEARFLVKGEYKAVDLTDTKRLGVELKPELFDRRRDRTAIKLNAKLITNVNEVIQVIGLTGVLPPAVTEEEREQKARDLSQNQKVHLNAAAVLADAGSPFAIEIVVKKGAGDYAQRIPQAKDGEAYLAIAQDEIYAVRLINKSLHEVAVTLTIDGLNVFALSKLAIRDAASGAVTYPLITIPPGKTAEMRGWPLTLKKSAEFKVTSYGESAVAELGGDAKKAGVITALFAVSWPKGDKAPADEGGKATATGRGSEIDTPFKTVERNVGRVRAFVSVRYTR